MAAAAAHRTRLSPSDRDEIDTFIDNSIQFLVSKKGIGQATKDIQEVKDRMIRQAQSADGLAIKLHRDEPTKYYKLEPSSVLTDYISDAFRRIRQRYSEELAERPDASDDLFGEGMPLKGGLTGTIGSRRLAKKNVLRKSIEPMADFDVDELFGEGMYAKARKGGVVSGGGFGSRSPVVHKQKEALAVARAMDPNRDQPSLASRGVGMRIPRAGGMLTGGGMERVVGGARRMYGGMLTGGMDPPIPPRRAQEMAGGPRMPEPPELADVLPPPPPPPLQQAAAAAQARARARTPRRVRGGMAGGMSTGGMSTGGAVSGGMVSGGEMEGAGFLEDFGRGFMMPFKAVSGIAKPFLPAVAQAGLSAIGLGKPKPKRQVSQRMKQRAEMVRRVMKERGCSLGEASRIVKEEGMF